MGPTTTSVRPDSELHHTAALVTGANAGDERSWSLIVERHYRFLLFTAQSVAARGHAIDAEDVLQAGLVRAWENISKFEYRGDGSLRWWLKRVVMNTLMDMLRRQDNPSHARQLSSSNTELDRLEDSHTVPPMKAAVDKELREQLFQSLARLPEEERDLVIMRKLEGLSWDEIADLLDLPRTTARRRYEKALDRLQDWMA